MASNKNVKILVIRFSSIGDIVLTSPIVRALKKQISNSEIHFLTKAKFKEIVEHNIYIDKIHTIESSIFECLSILKKENYDLIIDLHKNIRTLLLKSLLFKPTFSFNKINFAKWLIVNFKINILPNKHLVDRYFEGLNKLKIKNDGLGLDFFSNNTTSLPQKFNDFVSKNSEFYVFVLSGTYTTKKCNLEKILEICNSINCSVVFLGGKSELSTSYQVENNLKYSFLNLCNETNIQQSSLIIEKSKFVVTHDTGMMHISTALKKPLISIWGNTIPEFGMYPYYPNNQTNNFLISEVKNLKCRPCSKLGKKSCPEKHFKCINEINSQEICYFIDQNSFSNTNLTIS